MDQRFFLRRGDLVVLQGRGATVQVTGGEVWITQHADVNDYVARDTIWRVESEGAVVVHALDNCHVFATGLAGAGARLRRRGELEPPAAETAWVAAAQALRRWFALA